MSGGLTSLDSAIRTCRVNTGDADRIQSNRFIGCPDEKMCPTFLGTDLTGRSVCPDSFMTKSAGCNTAGDRIFIENTVSRPHYYEYINLSSRGLNGDRVEDFGFGQQGSSFIRNGPSGAGAVVFNASQTGQLQMPLWPYGAVPAGMPYSQFYGQAAEEQRLKQALWLRASALGQNPKADSNPGRYEYKMIGDY